MKNFWNWFMNPPTHGPRSILLIRLMTGSVFLWEGLMKFALVNQGVGRFTKLGFPMPELTAHFVAGFEIVGGICLILGFLTRPVALGFVIEMCVASLTTKIALYYGRSPLAPPPAPPISGMWAVLHEIRSEYAQNLTSLFLLIAGPGPISLDARKEKS